MYVCWEYLKGDSTMCVICDVCVCRTSRSTLKMALVVMRCVAPQLNVSLSLKKADEDTFFDARRPFDGRHATRLEPMPGSVDEQGDATSRTAARCSRHRDELALGVAFIRFFLGSV